jgi:hypothetical protein
MYAPRDHFSRIFLPSVAVSHGRRIVVPAKIAICEEPCEDLLLEWHATAQINATTERALWHGSNAGIHRHDRAVANGLAQDAQTEPARISPIHNYACSCVPPPPKAQSPNSHPPAFSAPVPSGPFITEKETKKSGKSHSEKPVRHTRQPTHRHLLSLATTTVPRLHPTSRVPEIRALVCLFSENFSTPVLPRT